MIQSLRCSLLRRPFRTSILLRRTFSNTSKPKPSKAITKTIQPTPPTSFLVPLAKSFACFIALGVIVRYARPLTFLLKIPVISAGVGFGALASVLRKYGGYSWKSSFAISSVVVLIAGGVFVTNIATEKSASLQLTDVVEASLLSDAVKMIETECGSGRVRSTKTTKSSVSVPIILTTNKQGESSCVREIAVRGMYVNGRLHNGIATVTLKYSGTFIPEWNIESVSVKVDTKYLQDQQHTIVQIFPTKTGSTFNPNNGKSSMFLTNNTK